MKHRMKLVPGLVLIAGLSLISGLGVAAGNSQAQKLKKVALQPNGNVFVHGERAWRNPDSCKAKNYAVLKSDHAFYRENYALLLLAHAQDKGVVLRLSGCVKASGKKRPIVIGATIQ